MRYIVKGADRTSGAAVEQDIEAPDETAARALASTAGLMVEAIVASADVVPAYVVRVLNTVIDKGHDLHAAMGAQLQKVLNDMAGKGWDFVSVATVPALSRSAHGGTSRITGEDVAQHVSMAVFRRRG